MAYGGKALRMGPDYFIPKPFDPRVLWWVAPAVAKAAMESGVARITFDIAEYTREAEVEGLERRVLDHADDHQGGAARSAPHRVPARREPAGFCARSSRSSTSGSPSPCCSAGADEIEKLCVEMSLDLMDRVEVIDPRAAPSQRYAERLYALRRARGSPSTRRRR